METLESDKSWDDNLKSLVDANPQAFVDWLLGKGEYKEKLPHKLKTWKQVVDSLLKVDDDGEEMLLHIEFQTYNDAAMAERLLRYNVLARSEYKLPVESYVIYLLRDGEVPKSPLIWTSPRDNKVLEFHFHSVELGEMSPEELIATDQPGLLPPLTLTKGGARRQVAELMLENLQPVENTDLITIGGTLASYVFSRENVLDLSWLRRRLRDMRDILRESPFYQEIQEEGREEGLEQGLEQGREEGQMQLLRQLVVDIIAERFPKLTRLARKQTMFVEDTAILHRLIIKLITAESLEEAREYLREADDDEDV